MHIDFEEDETQSRIIIPDTLNPKGSFKISSTKSLKANVFKDETNKKDYRHENEDVKSKFGESEAGDGELWIPSEKSEMPKSCRSKGMSIEEDESIKKEKKIYRIDFEDDDDDEENEDEHDDNSEEKESSHCSNHEEEQSEQTNEPKDHNNQLKAKLNHNIFEIDVESEEENVEESTSEYEQNDCSKSNGNDSEKLKDSHFPLHNSNNTQNTAKFMLGKEIIPMTILTFESRKQLLSNQIPHNKMLKCLVSRRKNIKNVLKSQFDMRFEIENGGFLATCRKDIGISGIKYTLSLQSDNFKEKCSVIGKIKQASNSLLYNVFDEKISNPADKKSKKSQVILATIRIVCRKDSPRETTVYILNDNIDYNTLIKTKQSSQDLESLYDVEENKKHITQLKSKSPIWIDKHKEYFLSFRGQAKKASYRNFVLENPITGEEALLFGKQEDNVYNINVCYPLAARIGFAIVIPHLEINN